MADQPSPGGDADRHSEQLPERSSPDGLIAATARETAHTPRWVKVFGIIGVVLVLLIIVMLLTGHSPSRHMHSGLRDPTAPVSLNVSEGTTLDGRPA